MPVKARRVAVIGAGPAGAIATDALVKEQAFDTIRVFDRQAGVGGTWIYTPHLPAAIPSLPDLVSGKADVAIAPPPLLPTVTPVSEEVNGHQWRFSDTALHENLHSNITPAIMSYTQEPFPNKLSPRTLAENGPSSPFRHHTVIREWIEGIFSHGGHEKLLELNTTVERAEKINDEWMLTLRKETLGRNYWWRETFDALVVATGHYNVPWFPSVPGLLEYNKQFPGRILHSKHFRNSSKFKGKRVVVVGGSISAHEIVHEILDVAQTPVYASVRGEPVPAFGWEPFLHPDIVIKKGIEPLDPETGRIFFVDGSTLDDVDYIVFATGYTFSVPYISQVQERIKNAYRRLPGVYQHTWNIEDPTLTFVGMLGGGFTFRVYEWQAVAVARHLAGRAKALPPISEQLEWERQRVVERGGGKNYYSIAPDYRAYFEFLRGIAGEPAPGTTGRVLPVFDEKLLEIWEGMVTYKIEGFQRKRKRADEARGQTRVKL
ncbi:FAD/NAD(P)-binding domain-containing protein [Annulohypoxylon bovei var. microspora]|nr:FAD/NAD(P)-binding domain-containing protein [Annulohypoxylon bovei var. microspora]